MAQTSWLPPQPPAEASTTDFSVALKFDKENTHTAEELADALDAIPGATIIEGRGFSAMLVAFKTPEARQAAEEIPYAIVEPDRDLDLL